MSQYKNFLLRQLGIKESTFPKSEVNPNAFPGIDPEEQNGDMQNEPSDRDKMMSPTAVATPVLAVAVRGSSTGGLPSGKNMDPSRLGGYEPIKPQKDNSELVNKTPKNGVIDSSELKNDNPPTDETPHPHQVQNDEGEPPQSVTGASTDDEQPLSLKTAMPQGIEVDVAEDKQEETDECGCEPHQPAGMNEGKHKSGCKCGFCSNKKRFGKKDDEKETSEKDKPSNDDLMEIRSRLQEKASAGKMNKKESELYSTITEVLQKRGVGLEQRLFGKKTMLEMANVEKKATCKSCGKEFTPSYGEHSRCPSCLSKQHSDAEKSSS